MKKTVILFSVLVLGLTLPAIGQSAPDPGKPDIVKFDSVSIEPGQPFEMRLMVTVDDTTVHGGKTWIGAGSMCLPFKYDAKALVVDSVKFTGIVELWDEKFTNKKIDTGFVSFAGINNIGGKENPVLTPSNEPYEIAKIFGRAQKDAAAGLYEFTVTTDPIQKDPYLGSVDGVNGWRPQFISGKILIIKAK